jgi:hypothetical protein
MRLRLYETKLRGLSIPKPLKDKIVNSRRSRAKAKRPAVRTKIQSNDLPTIMYSYWRVKGKYYQHPYLIPQTYTGFNRDISL